MSAEPSADSGGAVKSIVRAWDRFWFRPADPLPLGVIRIFTGLVILYLHLIYSFDLLSLVGPDGWLDAKTMTKYRKEIPFYDLPTDWSLYSGNELAKGQPIWSVYFHLESPGWIIATHAGFLVVMFMFTIGLATRLTSVLTWFGVLCYIHRLPVFLYGLDNIMNVLVIYLMVGPCGATLSVDRLIARWWARRKGLPEPQVEPSVSANFTLRLMQVHFCFIYMASGLSKLQGNAWWRGSAVWYTMANYSFAPMNWPVYIEFLKVLCSSRFLWELTMTVSTYGTLALEISFPFLIWRPKLRWFMICCSVLMHTGIGLIMGLTTFSLMMLCLVLAFVPASTHHALVAVLQHQGMKFREFIRGKKPPVATPPPPTQEPVLAAGA
jgi:hypothetical protein